MDAVEFLKKGRQMCDSFDNCDGCPGAANACCFINDASWCKNPEGVVAAVEQWAKDTPPQKTRQSEVLKQFPNADLTRLQPCIIEKDKRPTRCIKYIDEVGHCLCDDCRNDYWNEEVTDND